MNVTDPDSRPLKPPGFGYVQGYNAQVAINEKQIVIAAEDHRRLARLLAARADVHPAERELGAAGDREAGGGGRRRRLLERAPHDSDRQRGIEVLIPPDPSKRKGSQPGWSGRPYRRCAAS